MKAFYQQLAMAVLHRFAEKDPELVIYEEDGSLTTQAELLLEDIEYQISKTHESHDESEEDDES